MSSRGLAPVTIRGAEGEDGDAARPVRGGAGRRSSAVPRACA